MGANSQAKNTPNTQKLFRLICPSDPKIWDIVEKRLHWESVVRASNDCRLLLLFRAAIEEQVGKSLVKLAKSVTIREDLE